MKAVVRKRLTRASVDSNSGHAAAAGQSPEQNASAASGTYFRAVRPPTEAEADALARGEPVIDCAKVERLRSVVGTGTWCPDPEIIAQRMVEDAG
jgi:anti-sigma28 factor (negative regulator of flagellin synthesis)